MRAKLRSRAGESIAETLIALLISALALMMLAGAVSSAANVVTRSRTAMSDYYEKDAAMVERSATAFSDTVRIVPRDGAGASFSGNVDIYQNAKFSTSAVYSYTRNSGT